MVRVLSRAFALSRDFFVVISISWHVVVLFEISLSKLSVFILPIPGFSDVIRSDFLVSICLDFIVVLRCDLCECVVVCEFFFVS